MNEIFARFRALRLTIIGAGEVPDRINWPPIGLPALESGNASTIPTIATAKLIKRFARPCGFKHSLKNQKSTFRNPQYVRVF
jgi:hypothetical protein